MPDKHNPWVGLRAYTEGEILYGRDKDILALTTYILAEKEVVLYGKSGTGKSSIINAGVIPSARRNGYIPLDSFVSDCNLYKSVVRFDGKSAFIWRSGIKHDCSPILELTIKDGVYYNGLGEIVDIEDDLIYPLLKSSDVHKLNGLDNRHDRYLILPDRKSVV